METLSKWDEQIFFVNSQNEIENMTYGEYCREFGGDETTSPQGIAPRIHIREKNYSGYVVNEFGEEVWEDETKYQVWTWGVSGNRPSFTGSEFETAEEAENDVLENFEYNLEKDWNAPQYFSTIEEVEDYIIDRMHDDLSINIEVAKSIFKHEKQVKVRRIELKKIAEEKRILAKNESEKFISIEAGKLFAKRGEVENLFNVVGMNNFEKQAKQVADMKNLISHAGIEGGILKAPFWSVFKAVSKLIYESKRLESIN